MEIQRQTIGNCSSGDAVLIQFTFQSNWISTWNKQTFLSIFYMNFVEKTITDSNIWFKSTCRVKMTIFSKEKRPTMCITITATSREFQLFIDRSQLYCGHFYQFFKWTLLKKLQSIIRLKNWNNKQYFDCKTTDSLVKTITFVHCKGLFFPFC